MMATQVRRVRIMVALALGPLLWSSATAAATGRLSEVVDPNNDSLYYYNSGINWGKVDARKGLDTIRLYAELHPFATTLPGQVQSAIHTTIAFTDQLPGSSYDNYVENYNWLVKIQPVNPEPAYQDAVIRTLAMDLRFVDLNDAANMWYNYSLLFPDSADVAISWRNIQSIRDYQHLIPEDTTPFHVLTFPLQPKAAVTTRERQAPVGTMSIKLSPNPTIGATMLSIALSKPGVVRAELFDLLGKQVEEIYTGTIEDGSRVIRIDTGGLESGDYFVRVTSAGAVATQRLVVSR